MYSLTLFNQLLMYVPRRYFELYVKNYHGDRYVKSFDTWNHFTTLIASQIKGWNSLREIETGFKTHQDRIYHLGYEKLPTRGNLSKANRRRNYKIYEETFYQLLEEVKKKTSSIKKLKIGKDLNIFDSTIVTLSLELFNWATYRREGGFKIHTAFNVQSQNPIFAKVTHGNINDIEGIDAELEKYKGSIIVFDRGYSSTALFKKLNDLEIIFVTRLKTKIKYEVVEEKFSNGKDILGDQIIRFTGDKAKKQFKGILRLVIFLDKETKKEFKFITNEFKYKARTIAYIYKKRWGIEIFFKWIKGNLEIKKYLGRSENAVNIQVWVALISYILLNYVRLSISFNGSMLEFTRIVKEKLFEEIGIIDLAHLKIMSPIKKRGQIVSQRSLFDDF